MSDNIVLFAGNVSAGYGKKIIADGISFTLERGRVLTLIGPNGVGKSTVLKTITAQLRAISGDISLCGNDLYGMDEKQRAKLMSVLLTDRISTERMTCGEVAAMGRYPYTGRFGVLDEKDREIVKNAMELTNVYSLYERDFGRISDGQRQCVMLARAIAQQPDVLVLDEPTSYLDISRKISLLSVLRKLADEKNIAVIQSLHELDLAQKFSDTVLCIKDGHADKAGTPEEIFTDSYISQLYGIDCGSFNTLYGCSEPPAAAGKARVFVIGGAGTGIPVYRALQRRGIPFAAGVLHENDIDIPAARALAAEVVTERAYEPISEQSINRALEIIDGCEKVICCPESFGTGNKGNERLLNAAVGQNKIYDKKGLSQ
ncbi:MAG: ABC transporter ATP-binding protein [Firmicutes bacterium]|nr:ABC transporter ATP-binding protein [Bacillota bacterium]